MFYRRNHAHVSLSVIYQIMNDRFAECATIPIRRRLGNYSKGRMLPRGASNARQQMFDRARHPRGSKEPQDPRCRAATSATADRQARGDLGRNDLARCSHASGRRDIPSRAFSYPRVVFYNIPSVYVFQGEERFRRALLRRRGRS